MLCRMLPRTQRTRYITRLPLAESVNGWPHRGLPAHLHDSMPDLLATPPPLSDRVLTSIFPSPPDALCFLHFLFFADRRVGKNCAHVDHVYEQTMPGKRCGCSRKASCNTWSLAPSNRKACSFTSPETQRWSPAPIAITH